MPRGTRAVFGAEREGAPGGQAMDTLVSPAVRQLVGVCWCGMRFLRLDQRDVLDGVTYACKDPLCVDPFGLHDEGDVMKRYVGMTTATGEGVAFTALPDFTRLRMRRALIVADRYCSPVVAVSATRRIVPQIKREARAPRDKVRARRAGVELLWRQGKSPHAIATELDVAEATVRNDLTLLQIRLRDASPVGFDWQKWLDGRKWVLVQGRDYHCSTTTLCERAHAIASALDIPCTTDSPLPRVVVINGGDR